MRFITDDFLPRNRMNTVIISSRWLDDEWLALRREIEQVRRYADDIMVFDPIVDYDRALPRVLATGLYRNDPTVLANYRVADRRNLCVGL